MSTARGNGTNGRRQQRAIATACDSSKRGRQRRREDSDGERSQSLITASANDTPAGQQSVMTQQVKPETRVMGPKDEMGFRRMMDFACPKWRNRCRGCGVMKLSSMNRRVQSDQRATAKARCAVRDKTMGFRTVSNSERHQPGNTVMPSQMKPAMRQR